MHHHGRAGLVPALGQQVGVAQHVDVALAELREDLAEFLQRRLTGDGSRADVVGAQLVCERVRLRDGGGVGDTSQSERSEVLHPDIRARLVPQRAVEGAPKARLVEVATHPNDVRQVDGTFDAQAAKRSQDAALDRLQAVQCRGDRAEHLLDMAGGGRRRGRETHEDRVLGAIEQRPGLRAQGSVGLVADHEADVLPVHVRLVAKTRLIGGDRDARRAGGAGPVHVVRNAREVPHDGGRGLVGQVAPWNQHHRGDVERRGERAERDRLARAGRRVHPGARRAHCQMCGQLVEGLELMLAQGHARPRRCGVLEGNSQCFDSRTRRDGGFAHSVTW